MHIYPAIFAVASLSSFAVVLLDALASWSQSVRDKEFLVEMRLRNHEPEPIPRKSLDPSPPTGPIPPPGSESL